MSSIVVLGTQWGDEGKGKITDFLAEDVDIIVRYQGGNNAGHTVSIGDDVYKLHLIPSGIFHGHKSCVLGNGMAIDPKSLLEELIYLSEHSITEFELIISDRAHVIMPYHKTMDELEEQGKGDKKIGTTGKGIGPCYMDKAARIGIRMADLMSETELEEKVRWAVDNKNNLLEKLYGVEGFSAEEIIDEYKEYARQLKPYITDVSAYLEEAQQQNKKILFEGAQGTLLDLDYGTYPYVTASNPVSGGVAVGAGVAPNKLRDIVGVAKAYSTRVGDGPFPSEITGDIAHEIREKGQEYGTTTGRPRRIGWLDMVVLNYSKRINGFNHIALTLLDVMTGFDRIKICVGYRYRGETITYFPASQEMLSECEPIFKELPGWEEDISQIERWEDFPENAKNYVRKIEELTDIPVSIVSVGPKRAQTKIKNSI